MFSTFELLVPLIAGLTLLAFILWEKFRPEKPLSRQSMESGFEPGAASNVTALFVLGATGICFGLFLIANPVHPPFTGRGSVISSVLYVMLGPYGEPALCMVFSVLVIVRGFVVKSSHSRKGRKSRAEEP